MRVEWSEKALNEAESIVNYIFEENPIAALETDDLIRNAIGLLEKMPLAGRYGKVADTRELVINRNYFVVYEIADNRVLILGVKHTRQRYP
ncbi:addiction module toxin, RelE/StbE family [Neisseria mucosa ATCC 25996]|uniref:Addiction module toxin, RelE/StbE family n=1 Tax=Neisseria mucosa (strain ATCC 25996 / DSM 4631 / NCTC 10774 / M26) TaxID=546266 RepID=D2ZT22_NEIM2|nr:MULTISPECIES: type II toxin-antitoxin system RelE/ParE family toxin [Neisseria]EFC89955.1 addiction module toxin, RelE/StbE family [Neisseria mucosa ATCC 25996]SUA37325.1 Toxin RelE2 [Neisseria mucosa]